MPRSWTRRDFLWTLAGASAAGLTGCATDRQYVYPRRPEEPAHGLLVRRALEPTPPPPPCRSPKELDEVVAGLYLRDRFEGMRKLALTYDDGPRTYTSTRILDTLGERGVKAIFFVNGRSVRGHKKTFRRMVEEGHEIGNHTFTHKNLGAMNGKEIDWEFERTQRVCDKAAGGPVPIKYYRPPFGSPWFYTGVGRHALRARVARAIDRRGGLLAMWQLHSTDSKPDVTREHILMRIRKRLEGNRGGALVMHDTNYMSAKLLPKLLDSIEEAGWEVCSLDELVRAKYGCPPERLVRQPTTKRGALSDEVSLLPRSAPCVGPAAPPPPPARAARSS